MAGVVSSSNFQLLLEPRLRKIFFEAYDELPEQFPQVFRVNSSKKAKEHDFHVDGVGTWPEKEPMGPVHYETIDPSFEVFYTHKEFAKGCQVERKLVDDEQYNVIDKMPKNIARTGRATVEETSISVLNDGFTKDGYDGVPLFSDNHPLPKAAETCSNLLEEELTEGAVREALILARKQRDGSGMKIQCHPKKLLIPPDREFDALVILQSHQVPGDSDNDINPVKGKLTPVVLDYLEDEDAWFLQDPNLHGLIFWWRIRPEFKGEDNFDTMVAKYIGYFRMSAGYSDWRGMVGCRPADESDE